MNETLIASYRSTSYGEFQFPYHSHQDYEIYFFHAGNCRYLIHNQIFDLEPGDIIIMDGLTQHKPNVNPSTEYVRSILQFSPTWVRGILEEMGSIYLLETFQTIHNGLIRTRENKESKELEKLYSRLAILKKSTTFPNLQAETEIKILLLQVLIIVHELVQMNLSEVSIKKDEKAVHAENIAEYIQKHFINRLTLQGIADELNLSRSYVAHVFKTITGYTIMEFVMECRLIQAKYLLEMEPHKPLKDVAFESGFESSTHFSRYFREKVGITPKDFRQVRLRNSISI
ncbi:AraC family transcriptional regulator [Bacillus sinesaloumensis]|uniref:AraC family transcriptional regulator n=1 Tax=Litchfieldia sinesaloumensis TaxID=1926280 RepID=UPI0013563EDC|nr:helix-turn-helix domain-containing protein [Bacillus sinesaloumensis]